MGNPIRYIDPDGRKADDIIDIDKTTGQITHTSAEGDDVVRLVENGDVQSQYTYGENGSFLEENKIESASESKTQMITFTDSEKAQTFYEFAANSNVEFAKIDFDSPIMDGKSIVMTDQKRATVNTNSLLINLVLFQSAEILKHSHTHPMGANWPTGYDFFTKKPHPPGTENHNKGDTGHVKMFRSGFYPGFKSTIFEILTPQTGEITTYDGVNKYKVNGGK